MGSGLDSRPYGETGEQVTVLGLGGACLDKYSFNDGVATVQRALELGITYFDTSPFYGNGMSQAILGVALEGRPEDYLLATKIGHMAAPDRFRSLEALRAQLDENLRLLRRESVDTLQVHEADWHVWWSDDPPNTGRIRPELEYDFAGAPVMALLQEATTEGRCRYMGITGNSADDLARVLQGMDVNVCLPAFHYDLLRRGTRREVLPVAQARQVAVVLGGIFQNGHDADVHPEWLASPPSWMAPELRTRYETLCVVQRDSGISLVELTIRYLLADSDYSTILVGAATPAEIDEDVAAAQAGPLPPDLHQALEELGLP